MVYSKEVYAAAEASAEPVVSPLSNEQDTPLSNTKLMVVQD